jgi:signal transduction histidine kinase
MLSFESIRKAIVHAKKRSIVQRYILEITKENVNHCEELMRMADDMQIHHSDHIEANFVINEKEYLSSITMKERYQAIYSNVREIVEQEAGIFETFWNSSLPAKYRIREIREGTEPEFLEVIYEAQKATDIYIDLARSVSSEALLLFANSRAMVRADRLGVVDHLIKASKKGASIRIICPITEENSEIIKQISEKAPNMRILDGGEYHSGLLVVNNTKFIRFEIKEAQAQDFQDAVGFIIYSNTRVSVYSARSFFELLWNERVQYKKLKEADEMKSEFINIAAHELRTPIQPILGLADILRSKETDGGREAEYLDVIIRNAKRLQRLTEDILDISRIESKSLDLKKESFNLTEMIINAIADSNDRVAKEHKDTNLKLEFIDPKEDIFIEADKNRINQVISNLLSNAIKFTNEGTVSMTAVPDSNEIVVSITDTGPGIDSEILPRLFTKFATKSRTGTGLGLFISKSIIDAHGGKIWGKNNYPAGKGATFGFSLPLHNGSFEV